MVKTSPRKRPRKALGIELVDGKAVIVAAEKARGRITYTTISTHAPDWTETAENGLVMAGSLGPRESVLRWLSAPFSDPRKAERVLPSLLDVQLPYPLEHCEYAFVETTKSKTETRALAAAVSHDLLSAKLSQLDEAGLNPGILDSEALAIWQASLEELKLLPPAQFDSQRVVFYLGTDHTTMIIGKGTTLEAVFTLNSDDSARVERFLTAHFKDQIPAGIQWAWCGPGSRDRSRVDAFQSKLDSLYAGSCQRLPHAEQFLARALATRALLSQSTNLRSGKFTHPNYRSGSAAQHSAAPACLVAGIVLCIMNIGWKTATDWRLSDLQEQFYSKSETIAGQTLGGARGSHALTRAMELFETRRQSSAYLERALSPTTSTVLAVLLEKARAMNMTLSSIDISTERTDIQGTAIDWDHVESLSDFLTAQGYPTEFKRESLPGNDRIQFRIFTAEQ
jgi:hypothetical protein